MMHSDPEELLRSIERTREELALTVDTIAGRLDPKLAAKRGIGKVKAGVGGVVDGARVKLHLGEREAPVAQFPGGEAEATGGYRADKALASASAAAKKTYEKVAPTVRQLPKPAIGGGLAALLALAAVIAWRRRR
jgi:MYXO-CTERM domain-containing protein